MLRKLTLTLLIVCGILLAGYSTAQAWDCREFGCGCPGPEEWWEGECVILPAEPAPLPKLFIPWIEGGLVDATPDGVGGFEAR